MEVQLFSFTLPLWILYLSTCVHVCTQRALESLDLARGKGSSILPGVCTAILVRKMQGLQRNNTWNFQQPLLY